jgi:branched-chain amino acid transport system ATP-binding protein
MLLSARNVYVSYGAIMALQDVSVDIDRGEIVALIGANGAGKTTLLRTISGLLRPSAGNIAWNPPAASTENSNTLNYFTPNAELVGMRADQIVRLGISHVPEGRQIFANLTVHDNLLLGAFQLKSKQQIRDGLDKCFALFPVLYERKRQRSGTLSGGEQQMLAIARALMAQPKLLLLDEPSLGLAPLFVQKIFEIIRQLNQEGATIFLVEQNAHMALTIAHRGYVIQTGKIILADSAANLLQNPEVKRAYLGG